MPILRQKKKTFGKDALKSLLGSLEILKKVSVFCLKWLWARRLLFISADVIESSPTMSHSSLFVCSAVHTQSNASKLSTRWSDWNKHARMISFLGYKCHLCSVFVCQAQKHIITVCSSKCHQNKKIEEAVQSTVSFLYSWLQLNL